MQAYMMSHLFFNFHRYKIVGIILLIISIIASLQFFSWVLLYHLSYYILAHRIKVLRHYLSEDVELDPKVPESGCTISTIPEAGVVVVDR